MPGIPQTLPVPPPVSELTMLNAIRLAVAGGSGGGSVPTGTRITGYWATAPDGYVLADGNGIGNAASGANGRANADTEALFTLIWTNIDFAVVLPERGASAAADFTANKVILVPDERLRVPVMASSGTNLAGVNCVLGATGGAETHTLTEAELPVVADHFHTQPDHSHLIYGGTVMVSQAQNDINVLTTMSQLASSTNAGNDNTGNAGGFGSGQAHNNVQPFICINVAIKL